MQLTRKLLYLVMLLAISNVYALTMPCPGEFGISGEYLIMQNSIDQPHYAVNIEPDVLNPAQGGGTTDRNVQSWHSGYRVELVYAFCNCINDVRLRWTHFPSFSDSSTITSTSEDGVLGGIFPLTGFPRVLEEPVAIIPFNDLTIRDAFQFHYLDLLFSQKLIDCCPFTLDLHAGVRYGHIELKENLDGTNVAVQAFTQRTKSQMWGIGPEIGTEFNYALTKCFSFTGRGYASLLISKKVLKSFAEITVAGAPLSFFNNPIHNYWSAFPVFDLRLGLSYFTPVDMSCWSCCFDCFTFDVEVGYEVFTFIGGIDRPLYTGSLFGVTVNGIDAAYINEHMNYTFHGPYVHAGITF